MVSLLHKFTWIISMMIIITFKKDHAFYWIICISWKMKIWDIKLFLKGGENAN